MQAIKTIFLPKFCDQHQCHATIEQILAKQAVTDKRAC
jgi:hypothetical protein